MGQYTPNLIPSMTGKDIKDALLALASTGDISVRISSLAATEMRANITANDTSGSLTADGIENMVLERVAWCENSSANYSTGA